MYIQSIKYETISEKFVIIELIVRGKEQKLEVFRQDIQDIFDLAHDEWNSELNMLTLTFDKKPKEQTINIIKRFTKDYIRYLEGYINHN